ncbi:hypothetical protein FNH05_10695 [Amycolatopsis rhizosphaerae]|uniref:GerMN domain-containing protein n=1 Tax=Amycolatopsis rhizosphaerae TaxID=2053003 RepID=A0A558CZK7_9PSEU|nr:GerMN domain-containing protein [Amycolatopsis rhizosphaerae]TVT54212.1 hypothetical protein FNH05_10695 [Amycolatopsis rhizosphaerae]
MKRLPALLISLLALGGCGVRPTGVVAAGEPAVGVGTGPALYFVAAGRVRPVTRPLGYLGDPATALRLLADGPTPGEAAAGFGTALPPHLGLSVPGFRDGNVTVRISPMSVSDFVVLSEPAIEQVVCTTVAAFVRTGTGGSGLMVQLTGTQQLAATRPLSCSTIRP